MKGKILCTFLCPKPPPAPPTYEHFSCVSCSRKSRKPKNAAEGTSTKVYGFNSNQNITKIMGKNTILTVLGQN